MAHPKGRQDISKDPSMLRKMISLFFGAIMAGYGKDFLKSSPNLREILRKSQEGFGTGLTALGITSMAALLALPVDRLMSLLASLPWLGHIPSYVVEGMNDFFEGLVAAYRAGNGTLTDHELQEQGRMLTETIKNGFGESSKSYANALATLGPIPARMIDHWEAEELTDEERLMYGQYKPHLTPLLLDLMLTVPNEERIGWLKRTLPDIKPPKKEEDAGAGAFMTGMIKQVKDGVKAVQDAVGTKPESEDPAKEQEEKAKRDAKRQADADARKQLGDQLGYTGEEPKGIRGFLRRLGGE